MEVQMKTVSEYKDEIIRSVEFLITKRYFDMYQDNDDLFENLYHEYRNYNVPDFVVKIDKLYHINIWASENDLIYVLNNIDSITYVQKNGIGVLEDTIVGNISEFVESLSCNAVDYHYLNIIEKTYANITINDIIRVLSGQIMNELKNELYVVESFMKEKGYYDISFEDRINFVFALNYLVILNDGTYFYITTDSTVFPKIDFNNIVYIRKWCIDNPDEINKVIDSDGNVFKCTWVFNSDTNVFKKYNIDVMNEIDTY